jgi:hypothetical protein
MNDSSKDFLQKKTGSFQQVSEHCRCSLLPWLEPAARCTGEQVPAETRARPRVGGAAPRRRWTIAPSGRRSGSSIDQQGVVLLV